MLVETTCIDDQLIEAHRVYRRSFDLRNKRIQADTEWQSSLNRMNPARALIWRSFDIGRPGPSEDQAWRGYRITDLLEKRPGKYALTNFEVELTHIAYPWRESARFRQFEYDFQFIIEGDLFQVSRYSDRVKVQLLTDGLCPYVEVLEAKQGHVLHLPKGFKARVSMEVVKPSRYVCHSLWSPQLENIPITLTGNDLPSQIQLFL